MKFSILIPAYKEQYLDECITSCLTQTYDNYEIIIVNDNSPYNLDTIVNKFNDQRLHYYKNEVGYGAEHIVGNWNHCLEFASGDYVMCIGDDDKLKPNCLEDYHALITTHPGLNVYHMRMEIIDENSTVTTIQEERPETETVYSMIWHFWHGRRQVIGDWLFHTDTLRKKGGFIDFPYGWSSDNISAFEMATDKGVANTKIPGFQFRESTIAITSRHTPTAAVGKIKAWHQVKNWYDNFLKKNDVTDNVDSIYKTDIIKLLDRYIDRKVEGELEHGLKDYPFSIFKWMKVCKETHLSKNHVMKMIIKNLFKS